MRTYAGGEMTDERVTIQHNNGCANMTETEGEGSTTTQKYTAWNTKYDDIMAR